MPRKTAARLLCCTFASVQAHSCCKLTCREGAGTAATCPAEPGALRTICSARRSRCRGGGFMLRILGCIVLIVFIIGLLVIFGVLGAIF